MRKDEYFLELADKQTNVNQKYLCFENAYFYSTTEEERKVCMEQMAVLQRFSDFSVRRVAIVIVSYNNAQITKDCIESIRKNTLADTYQLVVVDNASTEDIVSWLSAQEDVLLIANEKNEGFPYACNQGIAKADSDADIFLLNNDTLVPEDAIFWLRMGLYERENVGAVGSVSNNVVNYQQVPEQFDTVEEWMKYAGERNVYLEHPYEKKSWLVGFAMLIKRTALNELLRREKKIRQELPEVLELRFSPGNYEDNDLSLRLLLCGYELLLCKNSFIFHYGGKAFGEKAARYAKLLMENREKLAEKYGMDLVPYSYVETALVDMLRPNDEDFSVLEINCKLGATLARIKSRYPNADVCGMEKRTLLAQLARQVIPLEQVDLFESNLNKQYDFLILDTVLKRDGEPEHYLMKASEYLSRDGMMVIAVNNSQCIRGIEDGFSLDEIVGLFNRCGLQIREFQYRPEVLSAEEEEKLEAILKCRGELERPLYEARKYIFSAGKV